MAKKYYAVRVGKTPGIYETWDEAKSNVHGFPAAEYKSFPTLEEADAYMNRSQSVLKEKEAEKPVDNNYAFVDGSFNVLTGVYGYGGFLISNGMRYELSGNGNDAEMASMRNVAGEILGSMAAVKKAIELGITELSVYFDYTGIKMWALGEWKRNKKGTAEYYEYMQSVKDVIKVDFIKVKGHSGVEGNEEADLIAKKSVGII